MNIYLIIILGSMLAGFVLTTTVSQLNLHALDPALPEQFKDVFEADEYARSQAYTRAGARLDLVEEVLGIIIVPAFILLGGFNVVDMLARSFGLDSIGTGLIFFGLLFLINDLAALPLSLYRTFVLEERFGFNRTNARTFALDKLKAWVLTVAIGGPLAGMVLWFFEATGPLAWLWAWIGVTTIMIGLQYIAPVVILPLFNKFTPLPDGELRNAIEALATKTGFTLSGLFMMDGSKRSAKSNAFFTGFGKKKRIALFDTLIEQMSTEQIVGVVAHEVGHNKRGHILRMTAMGIAKTGLVLFLMSLFLDNGELFAAFGMEQVSIHAGLIFFMLLYTPVALVLGIAAQMLSRRHEFEADAFAAEATGDPEPLISALKTLSVANLSNLTPHPAYVFVHYSHPPVLARIKALHGLKGN
ncbi:M48 family metallopeptidase [Desulfovibrio ferrophilus]|uniref:Ste24 endopeptidase n=1 Tax=Desulfovibrio ferrophilus TaxID=241368 RepID=A0A2Z6B1W0_9BACT|nr:M48 family metallopeptidase [Desulfovibrio ferrophilus]BBD09465.1 Ste24 endopeptidase [Desulfovibrio ferrophilus]